MEKDIVEGFELERLLVTGYRASELGIYSFKHKGIDIIRKTIAKRLVGLMDEGLEWVIVSGQWGVECWAAEAVLELKERGAALRLAVITPFLEQEENWSEEKQERYRGILSKADYVNSVTKSKYDGPWQFRAKNDFLLRNSDGLLIVYDEEKEGSPKYILKQAELYRQSHPYQVIRLTADDLESMAAEERPEFADSDEPDQFL